MQHDNSYKLLFSHQEMVADLLKGFVDAAWVRQCDFASLEKMSGNYVTDDLRDREDDIIWRVRWGDEWIYVYLLLEFQSSVDNFMAVRILTYLGLMYQDIIRINGLKAHDKLPPVLPIVLYNGKRPWRAPDNLGAHIHAAPAGLENYRPHASYLLLDQGRYDKAPLGSLDNLVSALFQLENSRSRQDMQDVVVKLVDWLKDPEQSSLRRAFTVWFNRVLLPRKAPDSQYIEFNDLNEVNTMLAETVEEWVRESQQNGVQIGEATILKRLLTRRFKVVPPETLDRIDQALPEQLEEWAENILDAATLEDVFTSH